VSNGSGRGWLAGLGRCTESGPEQLAGRDIARKADLNWKP